MALLGVLRSFLTGPGRNMFSVKASAFATTANPAKWREGSSLFLEVDRKGGRGLVWVTSSSGKLVSKDLQSSVFSVFLTERVIVSDSDTSPQTFWTSPWALRFVSHTRSWTLSHCITVVIKPAEDKTYIHTSRADLSVKSSRNHKTRTHCSPKLQSMWTSFQFHLIHAIKTGPSFLFVICANNVSVALRKGRKNTKMLPTKTSSSEF